MAATSIAKRQRPDTSIKRGEGIALHAIKLILWSIGILLPTFASVQARAESAAATTPVVIVSEIGIIGPASTDILASSIKVALENQASAVVLILDTPGGLLESARSMVQQILNAPVPVIVWVGPKGARAASAGSFITMAAHVAAMVPATNIGAAHPIGVGFSGNKDGGDGKIAAEKSLNDTLAMAEAIAKARGRNVELARSFVLASESITSEEALSNKVIDLMASSLDELLSSASGKTVTLESGKNITLELKGARIVHFEKNIRHRLLEIISDPNLFYLLFLAGIVGLGFELTHPGVILPGVAGAICMILALTSMSILPINFGGLLLLVVGIVMMVAEIYVPSFGSLGIGGLIAFILGSSLLIEPEYGMTISIWTIIPGAAAIAGFLAFIGLVAVKAMRSRVKSGSEGMIGKQAEVIRDFTGTTGPVRIQGEIWTGEVPSGETAVAGESLKISRIEGLKLFLEKDI